MLFCIGEVLAKVGNTALRLQLLSNNNTSTGNEICLKMLFLSGEVLAKVGNTVLLL
jgi:hypothetical protein